MGGRFDRIQVKEVVLWTRTRREEVFVKVSRLRVSRKSRVESTVKKSYNGGSWSRLKETNLDSDKETGKNRT